MFQGNFAAYNRDKLGSNRGRTLFLKQQSQKTDCPKLIASTFC